MALSPVYTLPSELFVYIFEYLDGKALGRAAQVCKGWKQLISNSLTLKTTRIFFFAFQTKMSLYYHTPFSTEFVRRLHCTARNLGVFKQLMEQEFEGGSPNYKIARYMLLLRALNFPKESNRLIKEKLLQSLEPKERRKNLLVVATELALAQDKEAALQLVTWALSLPWCENEEPYQLQLGLAYKVLGDLDKVASLLPCLNEGDQSQLRSGLIIEYYKRADIERARDQIHQIEEATKAEIVLDILSALADNQCIAHILNPLLKRELIYFWPLSNALTPPEKRLIYQQHYLRLMDHIFRDAEELGSYFQTIDSNEDKRRLMQDLIDYYYEIFPQSIAHFHCQQLIQGAKISEAEELVLRDYSPGFLRDTDDEFSSEEDVSKEVSIDFKQSLNAGDLTKCYRILREQIEGNGLIANLDEADDSELGWDNQELLMAISLVFDAILNHQFPSCADKRIETLEQIEEC